MLLAAALLPWLAEACALRPGFAVVAEGVATRPQPLPDALRTLWPARFHTSTSAKKAIRRRLVVLDYLEGDSAGDSRRLVDGGDVRYSCSQARLGDAAELGDAMRQDRLLREGGRLQTAQLISPGARIRLLARVAPGPDAGHGRRGRETSPPLRCCYEDDQLAVVYKPAGLSTQGDVRARVVTSLARTRCVDDEPLWRPQHVHRLDTPTSGLVIVAKTGRALRTLSACFAARQVHKQYRAIVAGDLAASMASCGAPAMRGCIRAPLSGQSARTDWRILGRYASATYGHVTLVDLHPVTGRTHQLRRHMLMSGHPILGDRRYWLRELPRERRARRAADGDVGEEDDDELMLCALRLELPHPKTGANLCVRIAQPPSFERYTVEGGDEAGGSV